MKEREAGEGGWEVGGRWGANHNCPVSLCRYYFILCCDGGHYEKAYALMASHY